MSSLILILGIMSVQFNEVILKHAKCPAHKPYQTDVGCVYSCPNELFINGSSCVVTCGEWFTDQNRICLSECPERLFVKEVVRVIGKELYLEKQCVLSCDREEFIFNGTCVKACPINSNYIINNTCTQRCPNGFPYLKNFTKIGILYHECYKTCPLYVEDDYCVTSCSDSKVFFKSKCTEKCPESHPYLHRSQCFEHCPTGIDANKTCVNSCPSHLPFIYNSSCIANCPRESPNVEAGWSGSKFCIDVCGRRVENIFLLNKTCVSKCPFLSFNLSCTETCPEDNPIVNNVTIGKYCYSDNKCGDIFQYPTCVNECPSEKYLLPEQNLCVERCPSDMILSNRTCLNACDKNAPFTEEKNIDAISWSYFEGWWHKSDIRLTLLCVGDCSESSLKLDKTCVKKCPGETDLPTNFEEPWNKTSQFFRFGKSCVRKCPESHPFVGRLFVEKEENCYTYYACDEIVWYFECLAECPENTYIYKNICLNICPDHLFLFGNACVESCPQTHKMHINRKMNVLFMDTYFSHVYEKTQNIFECISVCEKKIISNNTCVDFCTTNEPYMDGKSCHNNSCGAKYELQTTEGIKCLDECPESMVQDENRCIHGCSKETFLHINKCVETCPISHPYKNSVQGFKQVWTYSERRGWNYRNNTIETHTCTKRCPANYLHTADNCTIKCPDELKFKYNSVCVRECPSSSPFGIDTNHDYLFREKNYTCVEKCEDDYVFKKDEEACIHWLRCDDPYFTFQGQCLQRCPEGYKWFISCFHVTSALIMALFMILLAVILCLCCIALFKEVHEFIKICCMFFKNDRGQDKAGILLCLQKDGEADEPIVVDETENIGVVDIADISVFQAFNNGFINKALEEETAI